MAQRAYACEFCDTSLPQEGRTVTLSLRRAERWYFFDGVPAQVCPNCGHRYFAGPMLLELERLIADKPRGDRPVI